MDAQVESLGSENKTEEETSAVETTDADRPKRVDEKSAETDGSGFGSVFSAWGMPDLDSVTQGIGGVLGEIVEGAGNQFSGNTNVEDRSVAEEEGSLQKEPSPSAVDFASKELEEASKAAQETIGLAAGEIEKGWGKVNSFLDGILAPAEEGRGAHPDDPGNDANVQDRFRTLFPDIGDTEDVVDHYQCTLLQKYRCYLNNVTPEKPVSLRGRLFVGTAYLAMYVFDDGGVFDGGKFTVTVPFSEIARVQKGAKLMMRLLTSAQSSFIFADFESETHFNAALGLVEHMIESNLPAPEGEEEAAKGESET